jgi:hypothetical protein
MPNLTITRYRRFRRFMNLTKAFLSLVLLMHDEVGVIPLTKLTI